MHSLLKFKPILAGATLRDRLIACLGVMLGVGLTGMLSAALLGRDIHLPLLIAPIGASAVLVFVVPASPLAQPWPVIGGNTISAIVAVAVSRLIDDPAISAALACALAIAAMSLTRTLHPPGGAVALTTILGGAAVAQAGFLFPFVPVALNSIMLVAMGWLFHKLGRHSYPHVAVPAAANVHGTKDPPPQFRIGFTHDDLDAALAEEGESFDIDREDLERLLRRVENRALARSHGHISCADIMSKDVITADPRMPPQQAQQLLLEHEIRMLPVVAEDGRLAGMIGLRELARQARSVAEIMSKPATARPETLAYGLIPHLTDGRTHAVIVIDDERRVLGVVTQTDLLAAVSRA